MIKMDGNKSKWLDLKWEDKEWPRGAELDYRVAVSFISKVSIKLFSHKNLRYQHLSLTWVICRFLSKEAFNSSKQLNIPLRLSKKPISHILKNHIH